jgi:serine protease Do/serine protease DegQ
MMNLPLWPTRAFGRASRWLPTIAVAAAFMGTATAQPGQPLPTLAPMIERAAPAVVNISVNSHVENPLGQDQEEFFKRFFEFEMPDQEREVEAAGSGVIVDAKSGYILTNHHVVENADKITVTLLDNRSLSARVVGSDKASDIAVLQVEAESLASMPLGDSTKLRVGDYVVAIGNPFGFSNTVTSGIVSALGRSGMNPGAYESFIQTDASINPGNSGGALVNLNGELVGINSAIISRSGGNIGIGFAIPVNMVTGIMEQLIAFGSVSRGLLGVNIQDITPEVAATYGLHDNSGALVAQITPGSAAERAGIEINDIIVAVNDTRVRDSGSLKYAIGLLRPRAEVRVSLIREGKEQTVTAVLDELTAAAAAAAAPEDEPSPAAKLDPVFQGAELRDNDANATPGVLVASVDPGSPAAERGLRPGDVITKINRVPVRSLADARPLLQDARSIILEIQRGNRNQLILMR